MSIQQQIEEVLERIQSRGSRNFAIVSQGPFYVQIAVDRGDRHGFLEAVKSQFLPEDHKLIPEQKRRLVELGFNEPEESNWYQDAAVGTEEARRQTAEKIVVTLRRVYGVDPETAEIEEELDAW